MPTKRVPTKRQLFTDPKSVGPKSKKKRKKHKKERDEKMPSSVLKADYKISRKEEDLKEAQFEALAGEREVLGAAERRLVLDRVLADELVEVGDAPGRP